VKKNILFINFLIILFCSILSNAENNYDRRKESLKEKVKIPDGVDRDFYLRYLSLYRPEWSDYRVTSKKTLEVFKKYFKEKPYRVIWHWDVDGCGYNDYLAVEVHPKIRRGVKRGILVDELGRIKMYIDTIKGIYAPDTIKGGIYMIYDLMQAGIRESELECYSIGYIAPQKRGEGQTLYGISFNVEDIAKYNKKFEQEREEMKKNGIVPFFAMYYGRFYFQLFDKDLKIMKCVNDKNLLYISNVYIMAFYYAHEKRVLFELFTASFSLREHYKNEKRHIEMYRKCKKEGKVFGQPDIY
jgi:hypothetical protein